MLQILGTYYYTIEFLAFRDCRTLEMKLFKNNGVCIFFYETNQRLELFTCPTVLGKIKIR